MSEIIHHEEDKSEDPYAGLRATPEEVARILASVPPFNIEKWRSIVVPATPEELADLEEFLRDRELERERYY